jgi:hypothetical protein
MPDDWNPKHQLLTVIIGAAIGFIPAMCLSVVQTYLQGKHQQKEFLFEKRVAALKDCSAALNGDGELFSKYDVFEEKLDEAIANPSDKNLDAILVAHDELERVRSHFVAQIRPQIILMDALFKYHFPTFNISVPPIPSHEKRPHLKEREVRLELVAQMEKLRASERDDRKENVNFIEQYERALEDLGKNLY